jgi:hypothetical protein
LFELKSYPAGTSTRVAKKRGRMKDITKIIAITILTVGVINGIISLGIITIGQGSIEKHPFSFVQGATYSAQDKATVKKNTSFAIFLNLAFSVCLIIIGAFMLLKGPKLFEEFNKKEKVKFDAAEYFKSRDL